MRDLGWVRDRLPLLLAVAGVLLFVCYTAATVVVADPGQAQRDEAAGPTLVGAMGTSDDGRVTHHAPDGSVKWRYGNAFSYNDVSRLEGGHVLASYQVRAHECGPYPNPCMRTGVRIINPQSQPHVEWSWTFPTRNGMNAEVHDAMVLPDRGEVLVLDMDRERLLAVNMSTRSITWQWNASQHYDAPEDPTRRDWLHMNDVDRIQPGEYLVSVRNRNQLVVVNRSCTCVREVVNENGDSDVLNKQHNPQWLGPGRVLVADSDNNRVVELHKQPDGTWREVWAVYGTGGVPFDWPRDADRLPNGNTLVVDTHNQRVVEIDRQGNLVWRTKTHGQPYDAERNGTEYPAGPAYANASGEVYNKPLRQPFAPAQLAYAGIQHTIGLPYWASDWHVLVATISLLAAITGGGVSVSRRYRRRLRDAPDRCPDCGTPLRLDDRRPPRVGCPRCQQPVYHTDRISGEQP